jgi:peptide chain release factor 2
MRERNALASAVETVRALERERSDALEFAEMADAEGDEASLNDVSAQLAALKARAGRPEPEAR